MIRMVSPSPAISLPLLSGGTEHERANMPAEISAIAAADVVYDYLALLSMGVDSGDSKLASGTETETQRDEL